MKQQKKPTTREDGWISRSCCRVLNRSRSTQPLQSVKPAHTHTHNLYRQPLLPSNEACRRCGSCAWPWRRPPRRVSLCDSSRLGLDERILLQLAWGPSPCSASCWGARWHRRNIRVRQSWDCGRCRSRAWRGRAWRAGPHVAAAALLAQTTAPLAPRAWFRLLVMFRHLQ